MLNATLPSFLPIQDDSDDLEECNQTLITLEATQEDFFFSLEGLSSLITSIEATLECEGLDHTSYTYIHLATEAYLCRLGDSLASELEAIEEAKTSLTRRERTQITLETIGGRAVAIWNGIKHYLNVIWTAIKDFFKKIINGIKNLLRFNKTVKDDLNQLKAKGVPKAEGITVSIPLLLQHQNEFDVHSILHGLKETIKVTVLMKDHYLDTVKKLLKDVSESIQSVEGDNLDPFFHSAVTTNTLIRTIPTLMKRDLIGGKTFDTEGVGIGLMDVKNKITRRTKNQIVNLPTIGELEQLLAHSDSLLTLNQELEIEVDNVERVKLLMVNRVDGWVKKGLLSGAAFGGAHLLRKNLLKPIIQLVQHNYQISKAVTTLVSKCKSNYTMSSDQGDSK